MDYPTGMSAEGGRAYANLTRYETRNTLLVNKASLNAPSESRMSRTRKAYSNVGSRKALDQYKVLTPLVVSEDESHQARPHSSTLRPQDFIETLDDGVLAVPSGQIAISTERVGKIGNVCPRFLKKSNLPVQTPGSQLTKALIRPKTIANDTEGVMIGTSDIMHHAPLPTEFQSRARAR